MVRHYFSATEVYKLITDMMEQNTLHNPTLSIIEEALDEMNIHYFADEDEVEEDP